MPTIEYGGSRRMREASVALECQVGAGHQEIHFEVPEHILHRVLSLVVVAREPIGQWRPAPPDVASDRTAWRFNLSYETLAMASRGDGFGDPGMLFWGCMRVEFHPISPTELQAAVMRAYVMLWSRLFGTHPPRSVEFDLNQMGIFDVRIFAGRVRDLQRGWDPGSDDRSIQREPSLRDAHRVQVARALRSRDRIAKDAHDEPVKALAAPSSKLSVYRPQ